MFVFKFLIAILVLFVCLAISFLIYRKMVVMGIFHPSHKWVKIDEADIIDTHHGCIGYNIYYECEVCKKVKTVRFRS